MQLRLRRFPPELPWRRSLPRRRSWQLTSPTKSGKPVGSFRAVAAKGADGSGAVFIVCYSEDNNVTDTAEVTVSVPSVSLAKARCHLTDSIRTHTEVPLAFGGDGTAVIRMQPNSFALVEW